MGQKHKIFREPRMPFPLREIRKNPRSMYSRVPQAMAKFVLKIGKIVPYHEANPNTRNGARLRSLSPIMAPAQEPAPALIQFPLFIFYKPAF